jgi:hypothetical protein
MLDNLPPMDPDVGMVERRMSAEPQIAARNRLVAVSTRVVVSICLTG